MIDFKKNVKKVPGPKLKNSRNYTYSIGCNHYSVIDFSWNINNDVNWR